MSQTVSPSTSRCYGLARVSRAWSVSRAGVYRFLKGAPSPAIARRRPGPTGPCPDADLADHIRREIEASDFHGEGYRKLWARLRVAGVRSSPRRVRRVMGENGLLAPHRVGRNQEKMHDGTIVTDKVNEMWGTDMSQTVTLEEGRAYVFVAVEHANSEIIGIHAARSANRFEALEPVRQGVYRCFGSIAPGVARGLKLRHDHGSNYMSGDFQNEIKCLGIEASPSFVREPEGNGVAERFIRTLKENLLWVRTFKTIEELRAELVAFARRYNETWLVARHGYKTPARVREEQTMPPIAIDPTLAAALPLAA
jgi:putative transposase